MSDLDPPRKTIKIWDGTDSLAINSEGHVLSSVTDELKANCTSEVTNTITVTATNLDIRDLTHVSDSVKVGDGTETANVNASNELQVRDDDANTDLDTIAGDTTSMDGKLTTIDSVLDAIKIDTEAIETAVEIIDNAISGSEMQVDVITMPSVTVTATDLDIRDLTHSSDSVKIGDGTETANVNASNELQVRDDDANTDLDTIASDTTSMDSKLTTIDTVLDNIKIDTEAIETAVEIIDNAISGSEMQVDIVADGAGLALAANQLADGHNVTVDNAAGASAVNVQDGGNSISVDNSVYASLKAQTQITDGGLSTVDVTNSGLFVTGDEAHDGVDSGNPIKIGSKAIDYEPDTDDEQGFGEVATNDRANIATNLRGELIEGVNPFRTSLDNISTTYDDDPSTATSQTIECWNYRWCTVSMDISENGTATDIVIAIEVTLDGSNWHKLRTPGWIQDWRYDDTYVSGGVQVSASFPICAYKMRVMITCNGTDAGGNEFVVENAYLFLRN